jgi:lanosterol synthase
VDGKRWNDDDWFVRFHFESTQIMNLKTPITPGTNGSQLWDAAFISQALVETGIGALPENQQSTTALLTWLDKCQIQENPKWFKAAYRHATKGAWPFSTKEQGYTVSDTTAEGMKAVMMLQELP